MLHEKNKKAFLFPFLAVLLLTTASSGCLFGKPSQEALPFVSASVSAVNDGWKINITMTTEDLSGDAVSYRVLDEEDSISSVLYEGVLGGSSQFVEWHDMDYSDTLSINDIFFVSNDRYRPGDVFHLKLSDSVIYSAELP